MKTKLIAITTALIILLAISTGAAVAEEHKTLGEIIKDKITNWDGWTYEKTPYLQNTLEWVTDVKTHIRTIITDRTKSFEDRAKAQAYALGWDDRFDYVEKYGTIDEETGHITYDVPFITSLFGGLKNREKWFTNIEDYNAAMNIYNENYFAAVEAVPKYV